MVEDISEDDDAGRASAVVEVPEGRGIGRGNGGRPAPPADAAQWRAQLQASTEESKRRRAAKAEARRDKAARRKAGLVQRHAWRQIMLDARAADPPPR